LWATRLLHRLASRTTTSSAPPIRNFIPRNFRGKHRKTPGAAAARAIRTAGRWGNLIFGTGPRQTKPLDGRSPNKTRMIRAPELERHPREHNDFNANSRGVQGAAASPALLLPATVRILLTVYQ